MLPAGYGQFNDEGETFGGLGDAVEYWTLGIFSISSDVQYTVKMDGMYGGSAGENRSSKSILNYVRCVQD